jgi:Protein of unknown function (DUF2793)/Concanavalin A-like lectin/glucanases superfamily/Chaperone of endosialidase
MAETPRLDLPYIAASQAQKELVHNLSLDRLDLLCQCAVLDRNLSTPPGSPTLGDAYIVASGGTGAWAGHDNHLALYVNSQWQLIAPLPGFMTWVLDEGVEVFWSGTAWTIVTGGGGGATTYLALTDTENSYAGQAGKAPIVNATETGLEFGTTGGGAPPDATYIVSATNATLTAERVVTDNTQIAWDVAAAGQLGATLVDAGVTLAKLEPQNPSVLLGRGSGTIGDVQPITVGTGLTIFGTELSATGGGSSYTDEQAQDAVGSILTDSATLDLTYDDATPSITGIVKDASLTEAKLLLADVTTQNASTTAHGLLRKLSGTATEYLDGSGAWSTPAGGGASDWTRTVGAAGSTARTGLLAFWRMEEASGNRVDSVSGQALVPTGAPGSAAGKTGQAVSFDTGTGKYLTIADSATLSVGANQDFSVAAWIYFQATPSGAKGIIGKGNASVSYNNCEYLLGTSGTSLLWYVRSANLNAGITLAASTWYFVVAWYDATADVQYIQVNNGTPAQFANATGSFDSADPVEVGRQPQYTGSAAFNGLIDNVMFWKRTLTAGERTELYNSGNGLDYSALFPAATVLRPTVSTDSVLAGATTLTAAEPLESAGGLKLGTSTGTVEGIVRWTGTDMEARKGGVWVSMTGQGLGTMATQNANAVAITGGTISGSTVLDIADRAGNDVYGITSRVTAAGGTNRFNFFGAGNALNQFSGPLFLVQQLGIQTAPLANIALDLRWLKASQYGMRLQPSDTDTGNPAIDFSNLASAQVGSITTTATATAYNTSSDVRLKKSVQSLLGGLEALQRLRPVSFVWNSTDEPDIGFLAHELMTVAPNAVQGLPDAIDAQGQIVPQQVDNSKLMPLAIAGMKELLGLVESLTARVATLEQALGL